MTLRTLSLGLSDGWKRLLSRLTLNETEERFKQTVPHSSQLRLGGKQHDFLTLLGITSLCL